MNDAIDFDPSPPQYGYLQGKNPYIVETLYK